MPNVTLHFPEGHVVAIVCHDTWKWTVRAQEEPDLVKTKGS